jgi:hypothetical protein
MADGTGITSYTYHPLDSTTLGSGKLHTIDGPLANDTIALTYDALGRPKTCSMKKGRAFNQIFDGDIVYHEFHLGTEQGKTIGYDRLQHVLPGDLVVRDMGRFVLEKFRIIQSLDAYWLSRLQTTADVTTE